MACQLAEVPRRVPAMGVPQVAAPSVLTSKVARVSSGADPPRLQSACVPSVMESACVARSLSSRAMRLRVVAVAAPLGWRVVNSPPMSTFPSACTTTL